MTATKRIAKREIVAARSSSANRGVAFHCHGYAMVKTIVRAERTNPNSVVHRMVRIRVHRHTSDVLVASVYPGDGNAITNPIVVTAVTSMRIAFGATVRYQSFDVMMADAFLACKSATESIIAMISATNCRARRKIARLMSSSVPITTSASTGNSFVVREFFHGNFSLL